MKKLLFINYLVLFLIIKSNAQQCPVINPDNGLFTFDWTQASWDAFYNGPDGLGVHYTLYSPAYDHSGNINILPFVDKTVLCPPADGWTFIAKNFGTASQGRNNPYFVLYNKYTGVLRVFYNITNGAANNAAAITVKQIGANQSAILSNADSKMPALDNFNANVTMRVPNFYSNSNNLNNYYWLYADFTMSYDPCVCNKNYLLNISADLINTANIDWVTTGTITEPVVTDNQASESSSAFKTAISIFQGTKEAGKKAYEDADGFVDDANLFFEKNGPYLINKAKILNGHQIAKICEALEVVPEVGAVIGAANFFVSSVKKIINASHPTEVKPVIKQALVDLHTTGTITTTTNYGMGQVNIPGSNLANVAPSQLPSYNNPLGVFNLLETPVLEYMLYAPIKAGTNGQYVYETNSTGIYIAQYHLKNDLKYAFNPVVLNDYDVQSMEYAILMEYNNYYPQMILKQEAQGAPIVIGDQTYYDEYTLEGKCAKDGLEIELNTTYPTLRTKYLPLGMISQQSFFLYLDYNRDIQFSVKLLIHLKKKTGKNVPDKQFYIYTYPVKRQLSSSNTNMSTGYCNYSVVLKPISIEKNPWGNYPAYFCMGLNGNTPISPVYPASLNSVPYDVVITSNITASRSYTALNSITIDPSVTMAPGTQLTLYAGNKITYSPAIAANIHPFTYTSYNASLPLSYMNRAVPASIADATYCSTVYKANPSTLRFEEENWTDNSTVVLGNHLRDNFPNPINNGITTFSYSVANSGEVKLVIQDVVGNKVAEVVNNKIHGAGEFEVAYDASSLTPGIYLYTLEINGFSETKRMVIIK